MVVDSGTSWRGPEKEEQNHKMAAGIVVLVVERPSWVDGQMRLFGRVIGI